MARFWRFCWRIAAPVGSQSKCVAAWLRRLLTSRSVNENGPKTKSASIIQRCALGLKPVWLLGRKVHSDLLALLDSLAIQFRRLELPLLHGVEGGIAENGRPADELQIAGLAVFADHDLDCHRTTQPASFGDGGINRSDSLKYLYGFQLGLRHHRRRGRSHGLDERAQRSSVACAGRV